MNNDKNKLQIIKNDCVSRFNKNIHNLLFQLVLEYIEYHAKADEFSLIHSDIFGIAIDKITQEINEYVGRQTANKTLIEIACLNLKEQKQQLEFLNSLKQYNYQLHCAENDIPF
jgi:hypothetical protein